MKRLLLNLFAAIALVPMICSPTNADGKTLRWILNGPAVETFASDPQAAKFFAGSSPYVVRRATSGVAIPASWNAQTTRIFTNYRSLAAAFASGAIGSDVKAILYDNEAWEFTPLEEQRNFASYAKRVADLVHQHGLLLIAAPAVDLVRNLDVSGRPRYDAYLNLKIAADAARYADVYEIQAQGSMAGVRKYAQFVGAAAEQARAANPRVLVLAGISTNPSGRHVTADAIVQAIDATRDVVDGYWFNVPAPSAYCPRCNAYRPDVALDVVHRLQSAPAQ